MPIKLNGIIKLATVTALIAAGAPCRPAHAPGQVATITIRAGRSLNTFRPDEALGACVDGMEQGDVARVYTPANIAAMRSAGLRPLAYRLRTELGVEAWHWNPAGAFSDAANRRGYWTSDPTPGAPIATCNGYVLPRRGSTIDQANNRGYSRIDDGDPASFWKSNPYLDQRYTGEDNRLHPQWIAIDLGARQSVDALRIRWGEPFARRCRVEFWQGVDPSDSQEMPDNGRWAPFPHAECRAPSGGDPLHVLADRPVQARWLRLVLSDSSGRGPAGSTDRRDGLGYAVRELYVGRRDSAGALRDLLAHAPDGKRQTRIYVSSTDPWHAESDLDRNVEQPGFDRVFRSGLANGRPALVPVGLLYDTPENAAAEIRWLEARGYLLRGIEVGEEPDGQYMSPEDYGALYIQWAAAIHRVDPALKLGGPGFQTAILGWQYWPDPHGETSWMRRFMAYLKRHDCIREIAFFSFEWYPFDKIGAETGKQLLAEPRLLATSIARLREEGAPAGLPWILTEYGYSSFAGEPEVDLPGAILNAEIVAQFLSLGGSAAYLYGYEPNVPIYEVGDRSNYGNLALFLSDDRRSIRCPLPTYYGAQLLSERWAEPGDAVHTLYRADCDLPRVHGEQPVTAYAVQRPDGRCALLVLNKDPVRAQRIRILVQPPGGRGAVCPDAEAWQYGPAQYRWQAEGQNGRPARNLAPVRTLLRAAGTLTLPPYSLTVVRSLRPMRM